MHEKRFYRQQHKEIRRKHYIENLLFFLLIIFLLIIFILSFSFRKAFYDITYIIGLFIQENIILGIIIFILLSALSVALSPFSSVPIIPAAVLAWGKLLATTFLIIGWMIGATLTYLIGFFAFHYLMQRWIPLEKINYYTAYLKKKNSFWIVLLFRLAMPVEVPGYVLGTLHYNFYYYLLVTFLSLAPFAFLLVYASQAILAQEIWIFAVIVSFTFLLLAIFFYFFHNQLKK